MGRKIKFLDIIDRLIKIIIIFLIILFVLYPFISVFKKALFLDGKINISEFAFVKKESYLIANSLKSAILSALISTLFALAISLYTLFIGEKKQKIIMFILLLTMVSPPFIGSLTYIQLFGRNGFVTKNILNLSINPYGIWGIVSVQTLGYTSLNTVLLIGYLKNLDKSIIESARSLKATTTSIIIDIIIPIIKPAIAVSFLLSFIRSMADFSSPMIIGGAFNTLATEAYLSIIAKGNSIRASSISIILLIPSIIVYIIYTKFSKRQESANKNLKYSDIGLKKQGVYYLIKLLSLFFIFWISIQYLAVFTSAITDKYKGKTYFTLDNIINSIPYIKDSFLRSIIYSIIAGIFSSFIGFLLSVYSYIRQDKFMKVVDFIANMPYIVPGTFFGLGYIFAFNKGIIKLTGTASIVILNLIFRQVPMSIRTIQNSMTQIEEKVINSSKDLGAHNLYVIKDILFPLSLEGIFLSFTNAFISSMTTIGAIIFLVYPNRKLATLVLFDLVGSGKYKIASVLSCFIILICLIVSIFTYKIFNRGKINVSRN